MLQYRELFYKQYYSSQLGRKSVNYNKKLKEETSQLQREILPLMPSNKDGIIVDLGCGIGSLVSMFLTSGYSQSSGVDVSEEMVNVAHQLQINQVIQGDITEFLKAHKNHFDVITGIDIIEHFTKDELVNLLLQIKEALKPGGIAIFRTPNLDAPYSTIYANGDFTHENYLNPSSAKQVMLNCGYGEVAVLPSLIRIQNPIKEILRKMIWSCYSFRIKVELFASGRSSDVILTPNMLIRVVKAN